MNKSKLKRKIWLTSTIILISYIIALITNPTTIIALLPIIVITGGLTIAIPAYAIIKNTKDIIKEKDNQYKEDIKDVQNNNKSLSKENTSNKDYEINNYIEYDNQIDKPKIKTIGQKK